MQLLQRDTEQGRVREEPRDPALPVTLWPQDCAWGAGVTPSQVPSVHKLLNKIQWSFCSFSCWEQSCCWSGCSGTGQTHQIPCSQDKCSGREQQGCPASSPAAFLCLLTITCCSFQLSIAIFCLQCFFFLLRVYFYFSYIEFHLALHVAVN